MIRINDVCKSYQSDKEVLNNISLQVEDNELLVLLGESGCGKTTLLKLLNRLEKVSSGTIEIDGKNIYDVDEVELRKNIGYVVQHVGLFPHMTVKENIEIIGKIKKSEKSVIAKKTEEVMSMVGLNPKEFLYRYPKELSGGQAQRIGVARAYATNANIILMDEPFSALDPLTRTDLQNELLFLQKKIPKTIIFVTHDIDEAVKIADRIVLLNKGKIEQVGSPRELLLNPETQYVSKFLGDKRIWKSPWLIRCADVMSDNVVTVNTDSNEEEVFELFKNDKVQTALVVDSNGRMVGKLTEKIIMRGMNKAKVKDIMKTNFDYVFKDTLLHDAVQLMNEKQVLYLPVLNENMQPEGMINMTDLMNILDDNVLSMSVEG